MTDPVQLEPLYADGVLRIESCRNLLLCAWSDAPNVDQMRTFRVHARALDRRYPNNVALLNAVLSGTPRFSEGVRDEARRLIAEGVMKLGSAHLILVGGLGGAAARAFLSAAILLGRSALPARVLGETEQAARWLSERLAEGSVAWADGDVRSAVDRFLASQRR